MNGNAVEFCWHARMCHAARAQYLPRSGKQQGDNDASDASKDLGCTKSQKNALWHSNDTRPAPQIDISSEPRNNRKELIQTRKLDP